MKKNKILFLSSIMPDHTFYENSIGQTSTANDSLQRAILRGFDENGYSVDIINIPNIGAYPRKFKKVFAKSKSIRISEKVGGLSLNFLNILYFKHFFITYKLKKHLNTYSLSDYDSVFIYDCYIPFFKAVKSVQGYNDIKVILYLPDLIGYTGNKQNIINTYFTKKKRNDLKKFFSLVDIFVFIAEGMTRKVDLLGKKYTTIEGVWDDNIKLNEIKNKDADKKFIFYGGSLGKRHGILNLIEAFNKADLQDVDLVICGDGDAKVEIEKHVFLNDRIKYKGVLSRGKVLKLQAEASLLVNPRNSSGDFTKYSFPSKVLEYFTSGTPTFMYKLEGIPDEYYKYCFFSDDESIATLSNILIEIFNKNSDELSKISIAAREFILKNKTSKVQIQKIINLLEQ